MSGPEAAVTPDPRALASSLAPLLADACAGRLGEITWFRADWQRGGAATGRATFLDDASEPMAVVVKLPVGARELLWTRRLEQVSTDGASVAPRLLASGEYLGGYDLAWMVIEHFAHGPLGLHWHDNHVPRIADAIARFHAATAPFEVDQPARREPWDELVQEAADSVRTNHLAEESRWLAGLKSLRARLPELAAAWESRPLSGWLHGDPHMANAMSRQAIDEGPVSLIDLAEVHPGHWVEDAIYLERQLWARPERLKPVRPVRAVAEARKLYGLPVEPDHPRLAMIRRALLAATAPRFLRSEGHPRHLEACLGWLETALRELK